MQRNIRNPRFFLPGLVQRYIIVYVGMLRIESGAPVHSHAYPLPPTKGEGQPVGVAG